MLKLAKTYNKLCTKQLIKVEKAPQGAIAPWPINMDGLFNLDIDDEIWQDVGLVETDTAAPPQWMSDDTVNDGIKALLELDRCKEEEEQLFHECQALQAWFSEEWAVIEKALHHANGKLSFYLMYLTILQMTVILNIHCNCGRMAS